MREHAIIGFNHGVLGVTAYILYVTRWSDMYGAGVTYIAYVTPSGAQ